MGQMPCVLALQPSAGSARSTTFALPAFRTPPGWHENAGTWVYRIGRPDILAKCPIFPATGQQTGRLFRKTGELDELDGRGGVPRCAIVCRCAVSQPEDLK